MFNLTRNDSVTLREKRVLLTTTAAKLVLEMNRRGFGSALNECLRTQAQANANAASGAGIKRSLHLDGLAVDINLYDASGNYLSKSEDHAQFGAWWKEQHELCRWGGDFSKPDGNHYSIEHEGRR